jgi:hypothetical protein
MEDMDLVSQLIMAKMQCASASAELDAAQNLNRALQRRLQEAESGRLR